MAGAHETGSRAASQERDEDIHVSVIGRNFWAGKTTVTVLDAEKAHAEVYKLEQGVNRSLRHIKRRAWANTKALNEMAGQINTNISVLQSQIASLSDEQGCLTPTNVKSPAFHSAARGSLVEAESQSNAAKDNGSGNDGGNNLFADGSHEFGTINALTGLIGQLEVFGDESVIAFDQWSERFVDYVEAIGRGWNEEEKIARFKVSLVGTPRQLFKQLNNQEKASLGSAIAALRQKMDSPQRREISKRALALCKQRESETVSEFLRRLTPLVEMVNPTLNEPQRKEKICEEFLDRVKPNIGFLIRLIGLSTAKDLDKVKGQAEELETLLAMEKGQTPGSLVNMVHVLNGQQTNDNRPQMVPTFQPSQPRLGGANSTPIGNQRFNQFSRNNNTRSERFGNNNYRDRNNQQFRSQRRWNNRPICNFCGRTGHLANFCRDRQAQLNNARFSGPRRPFERSNNAAINTVQAQPSTSSVVDTDLLLRAMANLCVQGQNQQPSGSKVKEDSQNSVNTLAAVKPKSSSENLKAETRSLSPVLPRQTMKTANWEGLGPKITRCMMIFGVMLMLCTPAFGQGSKGIPIPKNPLLCQTQVEGTTWALPSITECSKPQKNELEEPERQIMWLYKPNAFEYEAEAWVCRKVKKNAQKHTSLAGVSIVEKLDSDQLVIDSEECQQMVTHRKCNLGTLTQEGEFFQTNNKIDLSQRLWLIGSFNWAKVSSENCYLFRTKIVAKFGDPSIKTSLGDTDHCPFSLGKCLLSDQTLILWNSTTPKNCEYLSMGPFKGQKMGKIWMADKDPLLITFDGKPKIVKSCRLNLTLSLQGFAFRNGTRRRTKRAAESMVTDSQLQSEMSYLGWLVTQSFQFSFVHAFQGLCDHLSDTKRWALSAALSEPTSLARVAFNTSLVHARNIGPGVIKIWPCIEMKKDEFDFIPLGETSQEKNQCFEKPPIKFRSGNSEHTAFLDTKTMEIVTYSRKAPCTEFRRQIFNLGGELLEVDQITAQIASAKINRMSSIPAEAFTISQVPLSAFHHLLLNNMSELFTHLHLSNLIKMSEMSYKIHYSDGEILTTPSEQWEEAKEEITKAIFGDWTLIWRVSITVLVIIVTAELGIRVYYIFKREYSVRMVSHRTDQNQEVNSKPSLAREPVALEIEFTPIRSLAPKQVETRVNINMIRLPNNQQAGILPLISCKLNGVTITALIDTGSEISVAQHSLIGWMAAAGDPVSVEPANVQLTTFTKHKVLIKTKAEIARFEIGGKARVTGLTVYFISDTRLAFDGFQLIIGMDILKAVGGIELLPHRNILICDPEGDGPTPICPRCSTKNRRLSLDSQINPVSWPSGNSSSCELCGGRCKKIRPNPGANGQGIFALTPNTSIITVEINSVPIRCLVDTGATVTVAPKSLAMKLNSKIWHSDMQAVSASGHVISFQEKTEMRLSLAGNSVSALVHLVEDGEFHAANNYQLLLGCDTLRKLPKMTFDFNKNRIFFGEKWVELGADKKLAEGLRVAAIQYFTIPANTQQIVEGKIESSFPLSHDVLVSRPDSNLVKHNVGLIPSVCTPVEGKIKLVLANPTNEPIIFFENMHLAYANEIRETEEILSEEPD